MVTRSQLALLASALLSPVWTAETRSESGRPRGVGPEFAKFYKLSTTSFTCISNPSISIPFSQVNDDFCDCPDGSDEPGTAACAYISPLSPPQYRPGTDTSPSSPSVNTTLALPGFYCKNKGHQPSYLRFEAVNDGICDYELCCDGSDEYAGVGGAKCPDKCAEIGKEHRKQEETRNRALQTALRRRKEMIAQAAKLLQEQQAKVDDWQSLILSNEKKVEEARVTLKEVEQREQLRIVRGDAARAGTGKAGVLFNLAKSRVEELRGSLEKTKKQRDAMLDRVSELEDILATLKEERNPNFNDEGVKRAVSAWEAYATRETDDHWSEGDDQDLMAIMKEDGEGNGVNWAEFENVEDQSDVAALYQITNYLPPPLQKWIDEKITSFRRMLVENGVLAASSLDTDLQESKAVQDAKKHLEVVERDLNNARNDLTNAKNDLEKDYGPDSIFRALKDKCISKDSGEYTYELCFLGDTTQKPKKGGGGTRLGGFTGFDVEFVDDTLPADGKGLGKGDRIVMKYENGQHCWNGPNRSARVILACNTEEEIWKVSESEKCIYRMEVGTAAVCGFGEPSKQPKVDEEPQPQKKDEL